MCIYLLVVKLDIDKLKSYLSTVSIKVVVAATILLFISQVISAFRMKYYFSKVNIYLTNYFSYALYFVGMLYNNIFPGGIGGDGYKIFFLKKNSNTPYKESFFAIISDRASGFYILIIITLVLSMLSDDIKALGVSNLMILALMLISTLGYFVGCKYCFKQSYKISLFSLTFSITIQFLGSLAGLLLFLDLAPDLLYNELYIYILVFLFSQVVALLPISFGSIGLREITFLSASNYLELNTELGVTVCFIFYICYLTTSFVGIFYIKNLEKIYKKSLIK